MFLIIFASSVVVLKFCLFINVFEVNLAFNGLFIAREIQLPGFQHYFFVGIHTERKRDTLE